MSFAGAVGTPRLRGAGPGSSLSIVLAGHQTGWPPKIVQDMSTVTKVGLWCRDGRAERTSLRTRKTSPSIKPR